MEKKHIKCGFCSEKIITYLKSPRRFCNRACFSRNNIKGFNNHKIIGKTTEIYIKDSVVLIDTEDLCKVNMFRWFNSLGYAVCNETNKMHALILGKIDGLVIDHINRNGLDNRKINLRLTTHSVNTRNCKLNKNNTSGFKGIVWSKNDKRWVASLNVNDKKIHLGQFKDKKDAIKCRKEGEIKYWGENYL